MEGRTHGLRLQPMPENFARLVHPDSSAAVASISRLPRTISYPSRRREFVIQRSHKLCALHRMASISLRRMTFHSRTERFRCPCQGEMV